MEKRRKDVVLQLIPSFFSFPPIIFEKPKEMKKNKLKALIIILPFLAGAIGAFISSYIQTCDSIFLLAIIIFAAIISIVLFFLSIGWKKIMVIN